MKITLDAEILLAALRGNVAEKKSTAPVYTHVLLDAHGIGECGHLRITSVNTSEQLSTVIKTTDNDECGEATVNPVELMRVLTGLRGDVLLALQPGLLVISQAASNGKRSFKLDSLPANTFPVQAEKNMHDLNVDVAPLLQAMQRVKYAAAKLDARYGLNGVFIGGDTVAATDGHRAALITTKQPMPYNIIVPTDCLPNLMGAMAADNARLQVSLSLDNKPCELCVLTDNQAYICRLVDAIYPDIKQILPRSVAVAKIEINCRDAAPVVDRAIPLEQAMGTDGAPTKFKCSPLTLHINKKMVRLTGRHVDDFFNCSASTNADAEISINARYLADVLHLGKDDDVLMQVYSHNTAALFEFGSAEKHIIMPMKV